MHRILKGINSLPDIIKSISCKNIFLVAGSSLKQDFIKDVLSSIDSEKVIFSEYSPNPTYEQIIKGIELFKEERCDGILAIGGGSPIDVAKCIKLAVLAEEGYNAIIPPLVNTRVKIDGSRIPFIVVPTTAGTGSESTHNAVMYYQGSKQTVTNDEILPDFALLEPKLLSTLPLYQKKCTMMDALCQAIESWWSVNSTDESYEFSKKAIELIIQNWKSYIFENNLDAAEKILLGANYAGRAINITATTAAHAMSYKITSIYKIPHGHAVACCLPYIWRYMLLNIDKVIDSRGANHVKDIFLNIAHSMECDTVNEAIDKFVDIMDCMGLNQPHLNTSEEIDILSNSVNPIRLKNNPVYLSEEVLRSLYVQIIQ